MTSAGSISRYSGTAQLSRRAPSYKRGVTCVPGVYFLGLPWLHKWKSAFLFGVGEDAEHIAARSQRIRGRDVSFVSDAGGRRRHGEQKVVAAMRMSAPGPERTRRRNALMSALEVKRTSP